MIRTVIVDDEPIIRCDVEAMLQAHADIKVVGTCGSVADATVLIATLLPDLVLLDVQLSDGNGFDIISALPPMNYTVIFITAFDKHAIRAIRVGALDYLLKPLDEQELATSLDKVRRKMPEQHTAEQIKLAKATLAKGGSEDGDSIALRTQQSVQLVPYTTIIYCEGDGNYTTFYLKDGRKIVVSKPLKEYEDLLPPQLFIRTHQSYMANKQFINRYDREGSLLLLDGREIPVSTRKKEQVLAALLPKKQ